VRIENAKSTESLGAIRELFVEYSKSLDVDLCFQGFAEELAGLPGQYAKPSGRLLLAHEHGQAIGCGALRRVSEEICEMKRLYVRPMARGRGAGLALINALMKGAREIGYAKMRLDTLPSMTKAIALYRALGFKEIAPYRYNPIPGSLFLEMALDAVTRDS